MTKEELKQEAEESADKWIKWAIDHKSLEYWNSYVDGYIAGAEPREKRIAELEAQIEKMKCCSNCDNWNWKHNKCEKKLKGDCFKHSKWIMRNF